MPGVSTKNFRPLDKLEDPALASYIIQRKFQNIQRKILKVSILIFLAFKPIYKWFYAIDLHSWSPDASFDTHIAMSRHDRCWMTDASFMSKMPKMSYLTHIPSNTCHILIWQSVRTSGMQTNIFKYLVNRFNASKYQNTDFQYFPLYILKFPLYNLRSQCGVFQLV